MIRRRVTHFANQQEQKDNIRKSLLFIFLSLALLVLFFIYGIPAVAKLSSFVGDFGKSNKPVQANDSIAPVPPSFDNLPQSTNQTNLVISGRTESGATVTLTVNSTSNDVTADVDGKFSFNANLNDGDNTIWATAKDSSGNISKPTDKIKLTFDNKSPELTISTPQDGATFFGEDQRKLSIQGKTDSGIQLTINDRFVNVNSDGGFSFTTSLSDGDNHFDLKATDKAGNTTEKTLTVKFST